MHINNQIEKEKELENFIPDIIHVGLYQISFSKIKVVAISKHRKIIERLKLLIYNIIKYNIIDIKKKKEKITENISRIPENIKQLSEITR